MLTDNDVCCQAPSQVAVLCLVCRDISSGLHYGIHTCESCKAFFKRSVRRENQGQAPSACRSSGDCPVTWQRKTGCQACRFAKCLAAGMRREAVRPDQTRGGRRSAPTSSSYDERMKQFDGLDFFNRGRENVDTV
ncbi:hypothetical protein PR048_010634 [Dryococelus australis]|uniref:Nuclear receptor domain-containing protein n=1 Tax=Dryococelus australis TaxID=614101 RepID=A0ABQ9I380_9NEOP|nr:hypothetical protein PR048_010634 [Dryococelus australis]